MLKGTIIENSLKDPSVLKTLAIEKSWQDGDWILHNVTVPEDVALEIGKFLADGPWYMHFWKPGEDNILVVYKDKNFWIKRSDKATWNEAVVYGHALGIPDVQLDFLVNK